MPQNSIPTSSMISRYSQLHIKPSSMISQYLQLHIEPSSMISQYFLHHIDASFHNLLVFIATHKRLDPRSPFISSCIQTHRTLRLEQPQLGQVRWGYLGQKVHNTCLMIFFRFKCSKNPLIAKNVKRYQFIAFGRFFRHNSPEYVEKYQIQKII